MPNHAPHQPALPHILLRLLHNVRQPTNRHRHVRRPHLIPRIPHLSHNAPKRLLPRAPQLARLVRVPRKFKPMTPIAPGHLLHERNLLLDPGGRAGELEKQRRRLLPGARGRAGLVDAAHLHVVEDLDGRDGHALTHHARHAGGRVADGGKTGNGDALALGFHGDFERGFGDEAERAFAADEDAREVVAGAALARPLARLDDRAVGQDDGEAQDPVFHRAVAVGVRAGAPCPHHAADHGARAGVGGEEEALFGELGVEGFPAYGGLDDDVEIVFVQREDLVHAPKVDADAAYRSGEVSFQARAARIGRDGDAAVMAYLHDLAHFFGGGGVDDEEGALRLLVAVGGVVGARVLGEVGVFGGDILFADDRGQVDPCGLQVARKRFVVGRFGFGEGKGRRGRRFDGAQGAKVEGG